jgi:murein DD-endopeptidase MepM/ murein hydrolase activator NlpD
MRLAATLFSIAGVAAAPATAASIGDTPAMLTPLTSTAAAAARPTPAPFVTPAKETGFHALFAKWSRMDNVQKGVLSIPSQQPIARFILSSVFGVRADPFEGSARMHAGLDMAAPLGTPVYATADGIVARAGQSNGYGNLIEIDHGRGIHTRYGHLSAILVSTNARVHRGDLIGRVGSTGRSTGNHLHYEVRLDDRAINPLPFLQGANYLMAMTVPAPAIRGGAAVTQVALATNPPPSNASVTAVGGPED